MASFFEVKDLKVAFRTFEGEREALDIRNISIEKGHSFGLVGESGAGKTILALAILGLLPPSSAIIQSGQILFGGEDLLKKSKTQLEREYRGRRIAMIFQDPMSSLNPVFTIGKQIGNVLTRHQKIKGHELERRSIEALDMVRLADAANTLKKYPHELSGGQRQRIIIAIALSCGAEFLIADEPTRNLDVTIQAGILKLIDELRKNLNISVLFIANNLGLINVICKDIGVLYRGRIVETGPGREVIMNSGHPYTKALLSAIPRDKQSKLSHAIHVMREEVVGGCIYYSRCPMAIEECAQRTMELQEVSGTHCAACIYAKGPRHE